TKCTLDGAVAVVVALVVLVMAVVGGEVTAIVAWL
nr:hypothetical protein [Tanacetum cinerariifolium]